MGCKGEGGGCCKVGVVEQVPELFLGSFLEIETVGWWCVVVVAAVVFGRYAEGRGLSADSGRRYTKYRTRRRVMKASCTVMYGGRARAYCDVVPTRC